MAKWVGIALVSFMALSVRPSARAEKVAEVGVDLHDLMFSHSSSPIEIWRKMRPQDFIGAPTIWQLFA